MRLRQWLAMVLSVGFMLAYPALAQAQNLPAEDPLTAAPEVQQLPQACIDAGLTTQADCDAVLAKQKAAAAKAAAAAEAAAQKAAADQAAADEAAAQKAAADQAAAAEAAAQKAAANKAAAAEAAAQKAAADQAAADEAAAQKAAADTAAAVEAAAQRAAADKAAADQAAADKAAAAVGAAAEKKAAKKAAADKVAADQAAADKAAADNAAADQAAADKAAADAAAAVGAAAEKTAAKKAAGVKAAADEAAAQKAAADNAAADQAAADKAAADAAAVVGAAAEKKAAKKAAADKATAVDSQPVPAAPADQPKQKPKRAALDQDCIDAGLTTPDECLALHAIAGQKAATKPAATAPANVPAEAAPAPATGTVLVPVAPAGELPAEVTPAKPAPDQQAEQPAPAVPALPDIASGLNAAAKSYNRAVAALGKAGADPGAADKARAKIKAAQAEIDGLCQSNKFASTGQCLAQYAIQLSPIPADAGVKAVANVPVQPVEVIDTLPKGVSQADVAPLLDSAKDQEAGKGAAKPATEQAVVAQLTPAQTAALNAPPPKSDKAAQVDLKPRKVTPIDQQKGQQIDPNATAQVQVPQNVTIVNQTVINNTTNNNTTVNTTNNTQNNKVAGDVVNIDQGELQGRPRRPGQVGQDHNPIGLGFGIILQFGTQLIISSPAQDQQRIAYNVQDRTSYERLPHERYRETVTRPDGVRIVTVYNRNGDILRRSRFDRAGFEIVLAYFDDSHDRDLLEWHDPGDDLPPLRLRIAARDYVLDADRADQSRVQQFFAQPPVERVRRLYSIAEVKRSSRIRDMVRRLEIGNLTFNTGAATISQDQVASLSKVAGAMRRLFERNPAETFLIEGHTDAVGSEISNLQLSDARAATVAQILTDYYGIPPENLATQGYGERYLKVQTDLAERLNRRVTVRRITSLVTIAGE